MSSSVKNENQLLILLSKDKKKWQPVEFNEDLDKNVALWLGVILWNKRDCHAPENLWFIMHLRQI